MASWIVTWTMTWAEMLGSTCSSVIRAVPLPAMRAAMMYSRAQICIAAPRVTRAKTGIMKNPMATMAVSAPGPSSAPSMIADRIGGRANSASQIRISTASSVWFAAAATPASVPSTAPTATAAKAVVSELKAPRISIEATSRPSWSVPSNPETSGPLSFCRMRIRVGSAGVQTREVSAMAMRRAVRMPPTRSGTLPGRHPRRIVMARAVMRASSSGDRPRCRAGRPRD